MQTNAVAKYNHPVCCVCARPVCLWENDGTVAPGCFECDHDNGRDVTVTEAVHDGHCRSYYIRLQISAAIKDGLEVREGDELNALTIADRSNNLAERLFELFKVDIK